MSPSEELGTLIKMLAASKMSANITVYCSPLPQAVRVCVCLYKQLLCYLSVCLPWGGAVQILRPFQNSNCCTLLYFQVVYHLLVNVKSPVLTPSKGMRTILWWLVKKTSHPVGRSNVQGLADVLSLVVENPVKALKEIFLTKTPWKGKWYHIRKNS